jgi:hypothetical protein
MIQAVSRGGRFEERIPLGALHNRTFPSAPESRAIQLGSKLIFFSPWWTYEITAFSSVTKSISRPMKVAPSSRSRLVAGEF